MELLIYPRLSTNSKRAFLKTRKAYGNLNYYQPRMSLIKRLQRELHLSESEVVDQMIKERHYLLRRLS